VLAAVAGAALEDAGAADADAVIAGVAVEFVVSALAGGVHHKLAIVKQTARATAPDFLALLLRMARFNTTALCIKDSDNPEIIFP
jgi:Trk K+ transport system NAD-binding subunit